VTLGYFSTCLLVTKKFLFLETGTHKSNLYNLGVSLKNNCIFWVTFGPLCSTLNSIDVKEYIFLKQVFTLVPMFLIFESFMEIISFPTSSSAMNRTSTCLFLFLVSIFALFHMCCQRHVRSFPVLDCPKQFLSVVCNRLDFIRLVMDQSTSGLKLIKCYWILTKQNAVREVVPFMTTGYLKLVGTRMSVLLCLNSVVFCGSLANTELFTSQTKIINGRCKDKLLEGELFHKLYIYNFVFVGHTGSSTDHCVA
jgi:hypothetical protein